jgi:hypothetical protein
MPYLWNTVNIHIPSNDTLQTRVELTKEWLDRSRQLPLHLSLIYEESNVVESELIPLFNVLQHVSSRWCTLTLGISPTLYPTVLGEVTCAPSLETLTLIDDSDIGHFHLPHTPLLKHLDVQADLYLSSISIEWGGLTTVKANSVTADEFFEVLRLSEGLDSLRLRGFFGETGSPLPTTPLTHSALRELYLKINDVVLMHPSELVTILDLVVFPSLEKFGYNSGSTHFFPNSALPSLFNRSHCQLTHFDLSGHLENGTTDDLISILSDLPTITHFKLEDIYSQRLDDALMSNKLLRRLTPIRPREFTRTDRLLPRLESLEFVGYKAFSWSRLASLVNATTLDGDQNLRFTPERLECTNSIRHISFSMYMVEEMERIDMQSLAHLQGAHRAGIFHCQTLRGDFVGQVIDPFSWGDDHL